nr:MAG TPA: hypothetical protein [Caudoviricetes sp.]
MRMPGDRTPKAGTLTPSQQHTTIPQGRHP